MSYSRFLILQSMECFIVVSHMNLLKMKFLETERTSKTNIIFCLSIYRYLLHKIGIHP